ncbi:MULTISPECIES: MFS transporter [Pandoraea]|uniref:MFS transporter n=1 Tax=Pandoraea TaxID=93217 RepID=UPI001F5D6338|nr:MULTISPECIES: MFS transporter [Pandoraea]MCI3206791.1 MFS transporter [Pandoraea sp. LA3]MDN4584819.1 MFS transporter [Pandoraea capi]
MNNLSQSRAIPSVVVGDMPTVSEEARIYRKIVWRLIPLLFIAYVVCYIDRSNVSYAYLRFKDDVGLTDVTYGFGAGIFFVGYILFEVPSNLLMEKIGARKTLLRIMVLWGLVSASTAFVSTPMQFYVVRTLLGIAEAGFFPGLVLYLTYWFPEARRARVTSLLMVSLCVAGVIGGPLTGMILHSMEGVAGYRSWQWMFLLEGLPAVLIGVATFYFLDDVPSSVTWLSAREKAIVLTRIEEDGRARAAGTHMHRKLIWRVLRDPRIYLASIGYSFNPWALSVLNFWGPTIIKQAGHLTDIRLIGLLGAIPGIVGAISMICVGWHSDRRQERRLHFLACVGVVAFGSVLLAACHPGWGVSVLLLAVICAGQSGAFAVFWSIPPGFLSPSSAAMGIAVISSLGQISGLLSSWVLGALMHATGDMTWGLYLVAAVQVAAGLAVVVGLPSAARKFRATT